MAEDEVMRKRIESYEDIFDRLLAQLPDGVAIHRDDECVYLNPSGAEMLAIEDRREIIGEPIMQFVHPDYREKVKERVNKMLEEGEKVPLIEEKFVRMDGEPIDVEVSAEPITYEGDPAVLVIFRDITERKKAERKFQQLFESSPDATYLIDQDGVILDANDAFTEKLGYEKEEIIGKHFSECSFVLEESRQKIERLHERRKERERIAPYTIKIKDDEEDIHYSQLNVKTIEEDDEISGYIVVSRDITERKKAEDELKRNQKKLTSLHETVQKMENCHSEEKLFDYSLTAAKEILDFHYSTVMLESEEGLVVKATTDEKLSTGSVFSPQDGIYGKTFRNKETYLADDISEWEEAKPVRSGFQSILSVPIGDKGVFQVISERKNDFTEDDIELAEILASHITESLNRIRYHEELKESQERYQMIMENVQEVVCLTDEKGVVKYINEASERLTGHEKDDIVGDLLFDYIHPDDREEVLETWDEMVEGGERYDTETGRIECKDGSYRWFETKTRVFRDHEGEVEKVLLAAREVTERRQTQEALKESEEKYRTIFESARDAIFLMKEYRFIDCNKKTLEIFRCDRDEIVGEPPYKFSPDKQPDGRASKEKAREKINAALEGRPQTFEWVHTTKDGEPFQTEVKLNRYEIDDERFVMAVVRDITERKEAEKALRESEQKFRKLAETSPFSLFVYKKEFLFVNPASEELSGYSEEELLDMKFWELVHPDHRDMVKERGLKRVEGEEELPIHYEFKISRKDGEERWIYFTGVDIEYQGETAGLGTAIDITERRKAEERIEHLNSLLRSIRNVNQLITKKEDLGDLMERSEEILVETRDYSDVEVILLESADTDVQMGGGKREELDSEIQRMLDKGEPMVFFKDDESKLNTALVPMGEEDIFGVMVVGMDKSIDDEELGLLKEIADDLALARRKIEAERELKRSLKEKDLLLSEIHHRVKNNMQVISSLLTLQAKREEDAEVSSALREGKKRIMSMALIHEMLYREEDMAEISLSHYIEKLVKTLYRTYDVKYEDISFESDIEDTKLDIEQANPCGLIINELLSNSLLHAFPDEHQGPKELNISASMGEDDKVSIVVSDNGVGIPEDVTLDESETFGLHLVKILAEDQLNGSVELERDGGTTFKIEFEKKRDIYD